MTQRSRHASKITIISVANSNPRILYSVFTSAMLCRHVLLCRRWSQKCWSQKSRRKSVYVEGCKLYVYILVFRFETFDTWLQFCCIWSKEHRRWLQFAVRRVSACAMRKELLLRLVWYALRLWIAVHYVMKNTFRRNAACLLKSRRLQCFCAFECKLFRALTDVLACNRWAPSEIRNPATPGVTKTPSTAASSKTAIMSVEAMQSTETRATQQYWKHCRFTMHVSVPKQLRTLM